MIEYNELVNELNFYDGSVGIYPPENIDGAMDILNEFDILPIETSEANVVFSDNGKQHNLYFDGLWKIKETFDINEIKEDALRMVEELQNDDRKLEVFGQLVSGIKNYIKLVKNNINNTYYIQLFIGENKIEKYGSIEEIKNYITYFFENDLLTNSSFYGWLSESVDFENELNIYLTGNSNYDTQLAERQLAYFQNINDNETVAYWENELQRRVITKNIIDVIIKESIGEVKTNKQFLDFKNKIDTELSKIQYWDNELDDYVLLTS